MDPLSSLKPTFSDNTPRGEESGLTISPDQVVAMLIKAPHVNLEGFGGVSQKLPFWMPVSIEFDPAHVEAQIRKSRLLLSRFQWALLGFAVLCIVVLGIVFYSSQTQAQSSSWRVMSVQPNGVNIWIGGPDGLALPVVVGAMMPSGEILRSVNSSMQSFSTDSQTTVVKK